MFARVAVQYITISGFPSDKVSSNKERGLRMFNAKSFSLKTINTFIWKTKRLPFVPIFELPSQPRL